MAKAPNTLRAYRSDWADFTAWCERHGQRALPATGETVALYLSDLASTAKVATLTRRMSAISQAHQVDDHESPIRSAAVRTLMAGIRRAKGTTPRQKAAAHIDTIRAMIGALDSSPLALRDRALLLAGFAGAFRRGELVSLDREDLEFSTKGVVVTLRRSKTDQEAEGRKVAIPYGSNLATCPVRALEAWLGWSRIHTGQIHTGPLFRSINRHGKMQPCRLSDKTVARVVKKHAAQCGLDPEAFAGHSLCAGFATSAGRAGVEERDIMRQTGHRSTVMVRRYIREGALFRDNAADRVGL
jgi:site-specific recombinase XerD